MRSPSDQKTHSLASLTGSALTAEYPLCCRASATLCRRLARWPSLAGCVCLWPRCSDDIARNEHHKNNLFQGRGRLPSNEYRHLLHGWESICIAHAEVHNAGCRLGSRGRLTFLSATVLAICSWFTVEGAAPSTVDRSRTSSGTCAVAHRR